MLTVVQDLEDGLTEQVLPRLLEVYPLELAGQLHYFLVFCCQTGSERLKQNLGEDTVNDMLAMVTEYGIHPDKCHLVQSESEERTSIDISLEWFKRTD
ncbi:uncharacterized protein METZ01_LOCUS203840 [marine metagenome]|uniref:Uncharacterized protein n=1 Tax=marine metagenome TaxID=408172 RepID=A0A382EJI7_9ZZZZ